MEDKKACIFSSGPVTDVEYIKKRLSDHSYIICADGGVRHCLNCGLEPDVVIGDMDSCDCRIDSNKFIKYPTEKDDTDTSLCIKHAIEKGFKTIEIFGALGGRIDHTFANIQMLIYCLEQDVNCVISDSKDTVFAVKNGTKEFCIEKGSTVSVFSYSDKSYGVTLKGFKYPLTDVVLDNKFPLGISNIALSDTVSVAVADGTLLIILSH